MAKKATAPKKKVKSGGSTFSHQSCHTTENAARKKAESIRNGGNRAIMKKVGKATCVYKGPKLKNKKKKR